MGGIISDRTNSKHLQILFLAGFYNCFQFFVYQRDITFYDFPDNCIVYPEIEMGYFIPHFDYVLPRDVFMLFFKRG